MATKKIPMRMCVGCREMKPKNELLRIVRTVDGDLMTDLTGKCNGRGAYLCRNAECLKRAVKSGVLARTFEMKIPDALYAHLEEEIADIDG